MNFPEDDGTDEGGIVRCECGLAVPCRHCPTPIDPADIRPGSRVGAGHVRPGDVLDITYRVTVTAVSDECDIETDDRQREHNLHAFNATGHLVSRPDPNAEAVEALRAASWSVRNDGSGHDPLPGLPEAAELFRHLWLERLGRRAAGRVVTDRLRETARVLRERAKAATAPDEMHPYGNRALPALPASAHPSEVRALLGGTWGDYYATMHPGVGLALADWLDLVGAWRDEGLGLIHSYSNIGDAWLDIERQANVLADLILGAE